MGYENDIQNVIRCLAVTEVQPRPYNMRNLPPEPGESERVEDGYGTLMMNRPNAQAETIQHPEFHTKTDLVGDPDYGQGATMNTGINV